MIMLRLFLKDNYSGRVHEYGTDQHDSLILMDDGSLHYEHLQYGVGTMFPEEGFSFCNEDGSIPALAEDVPYIDIGGEFYKKPQTNADRIRAMSDEELAEWFAECNAYGERADASQWLPWLQQPAEEQQKHFPNGDCK